LLRNNQVSGIQTQHAAPAPQDVHPQQYQAPGVGAPPQHQWGVQPPAPGPPAQIAAPPGAAGDWNRRLVAIEQPQPQQASNHFDHRDPVRPPMQPRQTSPRVEQIRYQEQHRHTPTRRPSPPPQGMPSLPPASYPNQPGLPNPATQQPLAQLSAPNRITNPNYGAPGAAMAPGSATLPAPAGAMPPIGRGNSPPPEIRPIVMSERVSSPGGGYTNQHYQHHEPSREPALMQGPPPTAALMAAEDAAARERDERPAGGYKRGPEDDEEHNRPNKKPSNGDNRVRLEDHAYPRDSPTGKPPSPTHQRNPSEIHKEEQRRANDGYYPSEAAHNSQTMQQAPPQPQPPAAGAAPQPQPEQSLPPIQDPARTNAYEEKPAREVKVDEDYDDDGESDKRGSGGRPSPQERSMNGQTKQEP
jgi:general transcriptional corepressor CYC8